MIKIKITITLKTMIIIKSIKHKAKFMSNMSFEGRKLSFLGILLYVSLREKYPNAELFLVRTFLYLDRIGRFTEKIITTLHTQ